MKPGSILELKGIKLYFPFFRGKDQVSRSLGSEARWLVSYLLLCDTVVIPPREFLRPENVKANFKTIEQFGLIKDLFLNGDIIITSPRSQIRDVWDLCEYYDPHLPLPPNMTDVTIYDRDENFQRRTYAEHLKKHILSVNYYGESDRSDLFSFLEEIPDHPRVMAKLESLRSSLEPGVMERIKLEALDSYFLAGAKGNGAIMPPSRDQERSSMYNPFYSKEAAAQFKARLEYHLGRSIEYCPPKLFHSIRQNLLPFRLKYFQLSEKYQESFTKLSALLSQSILRVDWPLKVVYAGAATSIASILAPVLSSAVITVAGGAVVGKFLWQCFAKVTDVTGSISNTISNILSELGVFAPYRKDIAEILGEFEGSVQKVMMR